MTSSVDSAVTTNDMATNHSSDDNSTKDKNKSNNNDKPLKAGYNNGLKKRGGHSTKQDPNKVDTSGERVVEPRQVVSACGNTFTCAFARVVFYFVEVLPSRLEATLTTARWFQSVCVRRIRGMMCLVVAFEA
jgi:hypothetical protein